MLSLRGQRERDYSAAQEQFVLEHVVGESCLDLGCGRGLILSKLAARGMNVLGVDPEPQTANIPMRPKPIEDCALNDNSWDSVISLHSLEHIPDRRSAVSVMLRIARKRVIVVVPKSAIGDSPTTPTCIFSRTSGACSTAWVSIPSRSCEKSTWIGASTLTSNSISRSMSK